MSELLSRTWRSLALYGAVSLVFGILAALWPGIPDRSESDPPRRNQGKTEKAAPV